MGVPAPLGKESMRKSAPSSVERVPVAMGTTGKPDVKVNDAGPFLAEFEGCHVSPHLWENVVESLTAGKSTT